MIKDNNSCQFATCSVIFIKSRLMNISNIMVFTQHSKDNEPASKRKEKRGHRPLWLRPSLSGNFDPGTGRISAVTRKRQKTLQQCTAACLDAPVEVCSFQIWKLCSCCWRLLLWLSRVLAQAAHFRWSHTSRAHIDASSGWKPRPRAGGSSWLGSASTSRLWGKMSEDQAWSEGFFHSGQICCLAY